MGRPFPRSVVIEGSGAADCSEHLAGSLEDRGYGLDGLAKAHLAAHWPIGGTRPIRGDRERAAGPAGVVWCGVHGCDGHADPGERDVMSRADLSAGPASVLAARHALEVAGIGVGDLATIDLYSCFRCRCSISATGRG